MGAAVTMTKLYFVVAGVLVLGVMRSESGGSCPPTLSVDECEEKCGPSAPCNQDQMCCPTACGGALCVDAMTERRFTESIKPGNCPSHPRGVWICGNMCTGDTDCPRTLKCCANRCGALTCQKPEMGDESAK